MTVRRTPELMLSDLLSYYERQSIQAHFHPDKGPNVDELASQALGWIKLCCQNLIKDREKAVERARGLRQVLSQVHRLAQLPITANDGNSLGTKLRQLAKAKLDSSPLAQAVVCSGVNPDANEDRGVVRFLQELQNSGNCKINRELQSWFRQGKLYQGGPWRSCLSLVILAQIETLNRKESLPIVPFLDLDSQVNRLQKPRPTINWIDIVAATSSSPDAADAIDYLTRALRGALDKCRKRVQSRAQEDQIRRQTHQLGILYTRAYYQFLLRQGGVRLLPPEMQYPALVDLRDEILTWQLQGRRRDALIRSQFVLQPELFATTLRTIECCPEQALETLTDHLITDARWSEFEHIGHRVLTIRALQKRMQTEEPFNETIKFLFKIQKQGSEDYLNFLESQKLFSSCATLRSHLALIHPVMEEPAVIQRVHKSILAGVEKDPSTAHALLFTHGFFKTFDCKRQCRLLNTLVAHLPPHQLQWAWEFCFQQNPPTNPTSWGQAFLNHKITANDSLIKCLSSIEPILAWDLYCARGHMTWKNAANLCAASFLQKPSLDRINQLASFGPIGHNSKLAKRAQEFICDNTDIDAQLKLTLLRTLELYSVPTQRLLELAIQTGTAAPLLAPFQVEESLMVKSADTFMPALISGQAIQLPELIDTYPKLLPSLIDSFPIEPRNSAAKILSTLSSKHQIDAARQFLNINDCSPGRIDAVIQVACRFDLPLPTHHPTAVIKGLKRAGLFTSWKEFRRYHTPIAPLEENPDVHLMIGPALEKALLAANTDAIQFSLRHPRPSLIIPLLNAIARSTSISSEACRELTLSQPARQHLQKLLTQHPYHHALKTIGQANGFTYDPWRDFLRNPTPQYLTRALKSKSSMSPQTDCSDLVQSVLSSLQSHPHNNSLLLKLANSMLAKTLKSTQGWVKLYQIAIERCLCKNDLKGAGNLLQAKTHSIPKQALDNEQLALHLLKGDWNSFENLFKIAKTDSTRWLKPVLLQRRPKLALQRVITLCDQYQNSPENKKKLAFDLFCNLRLPTRWKQHELAGTATAKLIQLLLEQSDLCEHASCNSTRRHLIQYGKGIKWSDNNLKERYLFAAISLLGYEERWTEYQWGHQKIIEGYSKETLSGCQAASLLQRLYHAIGVFLDLRNCSLQKLSKELCAFEIKERPLWKYILNEITWENQVQTSVSIALTQGRIWSQAERADGYHYQCVAEVISILTGPAATLLSKADRQVVSSWSRTILEGIASNAYGMADKGPDAICQLLQNMSDTMEPPEICDYFLQQLTRCRNPNAQIIAWTLANELPHEHHKSFAKLLPGLRRLLLETHWEHSGALWKPAIEHMLSVHLRWHREQEAFDAVAQWALKPFNHERLDFLLEAQARLEMSSSMQKRLFQACYNVLPHAVTPTARGRVLALELMRDSVNPEYEEKLLAEAAVVLQHAQIGPIAFQDELLATIVLQVQEMRMHANLAAADGQEKGERILFQSRKVLQAVPQTASHELQRLSYRLQTLCGRTELTLDKTDSTRFCARFDQSCMDFIKVHEFPFSFPLQEALLHAGFHLPLSALKTRASRFSWLIKAARTKHLYPRAADGLLAQAQWLLHMSSNPLIGLSEKERRARCENGSFMLNCCLPAFEAELGCDVISLPAGAINYLTRYMSTRTLDNLKVFLGPAAGKRAD